MNLLILNSGSSSIKYQFIEMPSETVVCQGIVERIGLKNALSKYKTESTSKTSTAPILNHKQGLKHIAELLLDRSHGVVKQTNEIDVVAHRVVHGGTEFSETVIIDDKVKNKINEFSSLAPLHNPHNLEGIVLAEDIFATAKQVAVFDTAFHQTLPTKAKKYAIPNALFTEQHIQVYGFHGTSHKYVSEKALVYLGKKQSKIISIHLGNGCSITAIKDGKSVDHSLGFAPSNGLIMGSRSGDIDHSIIFYMVDTLGYSLNEVNELLLKKSGLIGLTGFSDLRDVQSNAENGSKDCALALEMIAYRIKKYIGAYTAAMNGLDVIVFTAGIGENSSKLRKMVCKDMDYLNIALDDSKNELKSTSIREINKSSSKIKLLVIPTNEELEIAKQAFQLITK
jgi:acetate kinase